MSTYETEMQELMEAGRLSQADALSLGRLLRQIETEFTADTAYGIWRKYVAEHFPPQA